MSSSLFEYLSYRLGDTKGDIKLLARKVNRFFC